LRLQLRPYLRYKLLNSLFTGLSVGSIFTIYQPLEPSIYSAGGIFLALGMMGIARLYHRIMDLYHYFLIALGVEVTILLLVLLFLIHPYTYMTALLIYSGYQLTFIFGAYLVRAETLLVRRASYLTKVDISKQMGYLIGLVGSYLFYKSVEGPKEEQVYLLHYLLLAVEVGIIWLLIRSFKRRRR